MDDVLVDVALDVERGDLAAAKRRLRVALVDQPHRLDLRCRLAELYRGDGHAAQAGRWAYLSPDAPPEEIEAFRDACGNDPALMLEALDWGEDATPIAVPVIILDVEHAAPGELGEQELAVAQHRVLELRKLVAASIAAQRTRREQEMFAGSGAAPPPQQTGAPQRDVGGGVGDRRGSKREQLGVVLILVGVLMMLILLVLGVYTIVEALNWLVTSRHR